MWLHNGQTHGSSCLRKVQKRRREEKSRKATSKRDLQRKAQRRQKDESEKEKRGWIGVSRLSNTLHSQHSRCHILPGRVICGSALFIPSVSLQGQHKSGMHACNTPATRQVHCAICREPTRQHAFYFSSAIKMFHQADLFLVSVFES